MLMCRIHPKNRIVFVQREQNSWFLLSLHHTWDWLWEKWKMEWISQKKITSQNILCLVVVVVTFYDTRQRLCLQHNKIRVKCKKCVCMVRLVHSTNLMILRNVKFYGQRWLPEQIQRCSSCLLSDYLHVFMYDMHCTYTPVFFITIYMWKMPPLLWIWQA